MRLVNLFLVCSVIGCGAGPKVTVCISDPEAGGFQCVDPSDKVSFMAYEQTGNYVCLSPSDARTLLEASSLRKQEVALAIDERTVLRGVLAQHKGIDQVFREFRQDHLFDHVSGD